MNSVKPSGLPLPALKSSLVAAAFGTGSVFMALSQGSGELIWWPYIVGKYGLAFICLLLPACLLQYPVTYGICRYSLLTGESIFRGFYRFNKHLNIALWLLFTLSFLWFGAYATAGATALVELLPSPFAETKHNVFFWAIMTVVVYFSLLFIGRSVYSKIEKIMMFVAVFTALALVVSLCQTQVRGTIGEVVGATVTPHSLARTWAKEDSLRLLTAIMFAGLGGFWNLFNSYWVLAKRPGLTSSGGDEFTLTSGTIPAETSKDIASRWNFFSHMHVSVGVFGNYLTTLFMCILAFAFLTPKGDVPYGWKLAVVQSSFFSGVSWGPTVFLIIAAMFLVDTWLTTLDAVAKVQVDMLRLYMPSSCGRVKPRALYYLVALVFLLITLVTMFLSQPEALLLVNGYISAISMPILIVLVLIVNYWILPIPYFGKQRFMQCLLWLSCAVYLGMFIAYVVLS